jgi:hypothetical protein
MSDRNVVPIGSAGALHDLAHRRTFLKLMAAGGAVVLLPTLFTACSDDTVVGPGNLPPASGNAVTIDFARGDVAVLQFAYALEQLEADFYTRVVDGFGGSDLTAADRAVLQDIKYHEVLHRDWFRQVLGANGTFALTPTYPGVDFRRRDSVLAAAQQFEFLGVAAYNGAAQYLSSEANLLLAGKIVSVEARHASAVADLIAPKTNAFAPRAFENATRPANVGTAAQGFLVDRLTLANAPSTFVQGPNNNG